MATNSTIEWTQATWNPVTGCTKVSSGCKHCYAERMAKRLQAMGQPNYARGFRVTAHEHALELPLRWKKPRTIFANSMIQAMGRRRKKPRWARAGWADVGRAAESSTGPSYVEVLEHGHDARSSPAQCRLNTNQSGRTNAVLIGDSRLRRDYWPCMYCPERQFARSRGGMLFGTLAPTG